MKKIRFWIYWREGIVKITVTEDKDVELCYGGPTDEGYSYHSEKYTLRGGVLERKMCDWSSDCDGRFVHGAKDYWTPECGFVPCVGVDSQGYCYELDEQRPNWSSETDEMWERDYAAEAMGY